MHQPIRTLFAAAALICMVAACSPDSGSLDSWELMDGRALRALGDSEPHVVLVYDPDDCFSCFGVLAGWLEWGRANPGRFHLVLSRTPSASVDRALRLRGLAGFSVLAKEFQMKRMTGPMELHFEGHHLVTADTLRRGQTTSRLLVTLSEHRATARLSEFRSTPTLNEE